MSWIERILLGKDAEAIATKAEQRLAQSEIEWQIERQNFHAMRNRLLSTVNAAPENLQPISEVPPDVRKR